MCVFIGCLNDAGAVLSARYTYTDEQSGSGPLSWILVSHAFASVAGRVKNSESDLKKKKLCYLN